MRLTTSLVMASVAIGCHKSAPPEVDGAAAATPSATDATPSSSASETAAPSETTPAPAPAGSVKPVGSASAAPSAGAQFQGSYNCWNGMRLTQHGNQISGETATDLKHPLSSDNSELTCAVSGDKCVGTATEMFHDGKGGKKPNGKPRPLTLTKIGNDIRWQEASVTKNCPAH